MAETVLPSRQLRLTYPGKGEPWYTYDSLVDLADSATQAAGGLSDFVGQKTGADEKTLGPTFQLIPLLWLDIGIIYYSHELAHGQRILYLGLDPDFHLEYDFSRALWPELRKERIKEIHPEATRQDRIFSNIGPVNWHEFYATTLARRMALSGRLTFDEGMLYSLMLAPADFIYLITTPLQVDLFGIEKGDIRNYLAILEEGDVSISEREFGLRSGLAAALSLQTWVGLFALGRFLARGTRETEMPALTLGETSVYPPHFSLLGHWEGLWLAGELPIKRGKNVLFLYGGRDLLSNMDRFRFGAAYFALGPFTRFQLELVPSLYLDWPEKSLAKISRGEVGVSSALKLRVPLQKDRAYVELEPQLAHKDVIENEIKARTGQTAFTLSLTFGLVY